MTIRTRRRSARPLVVAVLVGALVVATPLGAVGLWQASASVPQVAVTAGTLVAPAGVTCQSIPAAELTAGYVRLGWTAVTGATGYRVTLRNSVNTNTAVLAPNVAGTSFDVRSDLLGGLGLTLGTLLTGGSVSLDVTALNNTWASPPSARKTIVLDGLGGLLGGLRCQ